MPITVTDENEPPGTPDAPAVTPTLNSLALEWTAPTNSGPAITDYDVQYKESGGEFADWEHIGTGLTTTITNLKQNTSYEVQVRAHNAEGMSDWSESVIGTTTANQSPTFSEASPSRSFAENTEAGQDIGTPVSATDEDGGTLSYSLTGTDAASFRVVPTSGQLQTGADIMYDYETKSSYSVTVRVEDGQGGSATIDVPINLTDENEAPVFISDKTIEVTENSSLVGTLVADDVDSEDSITDYAITGGANQTKFSIVSDTGALSFKVSPDFESPTDVASTTPMNAADNNEYIVIVTATGGAGARAMTTSNTITVTVTNENEAPVFTSNKSIEVAENSSLVGTLVADDVDSEDSITDYAITGGADQTKFSIVSDTGVLSFKVSPDFEVSHRCCQHHANECSGQQ